MPCGCARAPEEKPGSGVEVDYSDDVHYLVGYAQAPDATLTGAVRKYVSIGVLVDMRTGVIREAACTLQTEIAREFVRQMLRGRSLLDGEALVSELRRRYHGAAQKALAVALGEVIGKFNSLRAVR